MSFSRKQLDRWFDELAAKGLLYDVKVDDVNDFYRAMGWQYAMRGESRTLEMPESYRHDGVLAKYQPHPYAAPFAEGWDDFQRFARGELVLVPDYVHADQVMG